MKYISMIALSVVAASTASAQLPLMGRKMPLKRVMPPAVELDARSFSITATAQEPGAKEVAASFREGFRAKIQGDSRFVMKDSNPELKISIVVTRYYVEPKQLTPSGRGATPCTTYLGNLQGTFTIVEAATNHPLASDTVSWKLQAGRTKNWLTSEDGTAMNVTGPKEKLSPKAAWEFVPEEGSGGNPLNRFSHTPHPCDLPFTQNEARDVLADAFLTDLIHLAVPYEVTLEVSLPGGKYKKISEDLSGGRGENAREELEKMGEQQKPGDEAERLYLIALTNEVAGYKLGQQAFEIRQKIRKDLSAEETARLQGEMKQIVDQAKDRFDQAALNFKKADERKPEKDYRDAERRAEQSQKLYARIKRYRDLKPVDDRPTETAGLTMNEVVGMCGQGLDELIIVDRIEHAARLALSRDDFGELGKCSQTQQRSLFKALSKRLDSKK